MTNQPIVVSPLNDRARVLLDDVRGAVVSYLSVFRGTEGDKAKLSTGWGGNRPPSLDRAYEMLLEAWREVRAGHM